MPHSSASHLTTVQCCTFGQMCQSGEPAANTGCFSLASLACFCDVRCSPISLFNQGCPWLWQTCLAQPRFSDFWGPWPWKELAPEMRGSRAGTHSILIFHSDTSFTFGKRSLTLCGCADGQFLGCQPLESSMWRPRAWPHCPDRGCLSWHCLSAPCWTSQG